MAFTNIPLEVIREMLFGISYNDVVAMCTTNSNYILISSDNEFWKSKLNRNYIELNSDNIPIKPSDYVIDSNWRQVYKRWETYYNDIDAKYNFHTDTDLIVFSLYTKIHDQESISLIWDGAVTAANITVLNALHTMGKSKYMMNDDIIEICINIPLLEWFNSKFVMNHESIAVYASQRERCDVLDWLWYQGFAFDHEFANEALSYLALDSLTWLLQHNIYPSQEYIDFPYLNMSDKDVTWFKGYGLKFSKAAASQHTALSNYVMTQDNMAQSLAIQLSWSVIGGANPEIQTLFMLWIKELPPNVIESFVQSKTIQVIDL